MKRGTLALGAYVAVYAGLSLFGGYQDNITSLDKLGIITKCVPTRWEWQPVFVIMTHFSCQDYGWRANGPAYFFMPLVFVDQHVLHPTKPITY